MLSGSGHLWVEDKTHMVITFLDAESSTEEDCFMATGTSTAAGTDLHKTRAIIFNQIGLVSTRVRR